MYISLRVHHVFFFTKLKEKRRRKKHIEPLLFQMQGILTKIHIFFYFETRNWIALIVEWTQTRMNQSACLMILSSIQNFGFAKKIFLDPFVCVWDCVGLVCICDSAFIWSNLLCVVYMEFHVLMCHANKMIRHVCDDVTDYVASTTFASD